MTSLSKDVELFRGIDLGDYSKKIRSGDMLQNSGYSSTSISPSKALSFTNKAVNRAILTIKAKKGSKGLKCFSDSAEQEITLPRDAKLKVISVEDAILPGRLGYNTGNFEDTKIKVIRCVYE